MKVPFSYFSALDDIILYMHRIKCCSSIQQKLNLAGQCI